MPYQQPYQQPQYGQPPYGQPQYGQPGYPQQPPKKSKRGLIIALVIVGVLAVVGAAVLTVALLVADDRVVATDLAVGNCIADVPTSARVVSLPTVDCSEPHGGEVYAVLTMPDGDYPGAETIDEWQSKCPDALAEYSPAAMLDDAVGVYVLYPTQETWDTGDRAVTCIATLDPKRSGTLKE
jgi:hypothetical protein